MRIRQGTTDKALAFVAVDADDLRTRETGLGTTGFTVYYSKDGGTATVMTTPTLTYQGANMPGCYWLDIDESGMTSLTAGDDTAEVMVHITKAGMAPVTRTYEIYREETTAGETLLVDSNGRTDVGRFLGTAVVLSTGLPDVNTERINGAALVGDGNATPWDGA